MDALDFFLVRYDQVHRVLGDPAIKQLGETQWRSRPHPGVNTVGWLLWHMARVENVGVNRFAADRPQTPLLHVYGHYFEARAVAGTWGARSL